MLAIPAGFNLQDNKQCLPQSALCESNWRQHYAAVIGSLVCRVDLSKQIFQLGGKKSSRTKDGNTIALVLTCVMEGGVPVTAFRH